MPLSCTPFALQMAIILLTVVTIFQGGGRTITPWAAVQQGGKRGGGGGMTSLVATSFPNPPTPGAKANGEGQR